MNVEAWPHGRRKRVSIIGAGPAGLTAAYELQKRGSNPVTVLEADDLVGGIARTESYKGFRFDIGGHRFFTKVGEVEEMWHEVMKDDFIVVPRVSRIFYRNKYYAYPLKIFNALSNIGVYETGRIMLSYAKWRMRPSKIEESFEQWVINRFGGRLYMHFFRSYTEKVWGISPREIRADWAAQRIKNLSLPKAVINALTGANDTSSLIEEFHYPRLGPGMMWEKVRDLVRAAGGEVRMNTKVVKVLREGTRVTALETEDFEGGRSRVEADEFINTMAVRDLIVHAFDPPPPPEVVEAARQLKYRDFLIVTLVLNNPDPFPDNWIYIHSPEVKVGRIQNFRAWSKEMVPNEDQSSIGMEYFCQEGDGLWEMSDEQLIDLASSELERLGLAPKASAVDGTIIRQPKAYPVYDAVYQDALKIIAGWLGTLENFQTVGRNGLHRYNNQDHSMLTAMLAARNILGEDHDVWTVNVERSYHEEFQLNESKKGANSSGRALARQTSA
jgi:protoporphyrinogen oxidase